MEISIEQEKSIVKKTQKNKASFDPLYRKYKNKVEAFIQNKVGSKSIAEDLTSTVFEKALNKIDQFQWQGVSFGCWLFKIARNTVYDYYRTDKKGRLKDLSDDESEINITNEKDLESEVLHDEKEIELYSKISILNNEDQYLLYYRYFEGMSNKDISKLLGISESNVATRLHRIRRKLHNSLT